MRITTDVAVAVGRARSARIDLSRMMKMYERTNQITSSVDHRSYSPHHWVKRTSQAKERLLRWVSPSVYVGGEKD